MQTTLKSSVTFDGIGLHSGESARVTIRPAAPGFGIVFRRRDCGMGLSDIPALWDNVRQSPLCTLLVNEHGVSVSTVEHIMAALVGCGIHNALVEVTGPEIPILDGSSYIFVRGILSKGVRRTDVPVHVLRVLKPVEVRRGDASARIAPHGSLLLEFSIDFADRAIGAQSRSLDMANGSFVRELSSSRTFCRQADIDHMLANGLARGGRPGVNAVVFDGDYIVSPGGLRQPDEPVRHKMLDALGDLGLAGLPILGHYQGVRAGHALTNDLLRSLFADRDAFEIVECDAETAARLPGAGVVLDEMPEVA